MRRLILILLSILFLACNTNIKAKVYSSDASLKVPKIDKLIAEKDTYKYMGDRRFPGYTFDKSAFATFDRSKFMYSLVTAYYDTLTKKITRISIYSYKDTLVGPAQIDDFYFDDNNQLIKIDIVAVNSSPQDFAEYYFSNESLIYQRTKNIEVKDLKLYLSKVYNIYKKVYQTLSEGKLINSV